MIFSSDTSEPLNQKVAIYTTQNRHSLVDQSNVGLEMNRNAGDRDDVLQEIGEWEATSKMTISVVGSKEVNNTTTRGYSNSNCWWKRACLIDLKYRLVLKRTLNDDAVILCHRIRNKEIRRRIWA